MCVRACVHACVRVCVHVCWAACVTLCVWGVGEYVCVLRACVRVCVCGREHIGISDTFSITCVSEIMSVYPSLTLYLLHLSHLNLWNYLYCRTFPLHTYMHTYARTHARTHARAQTHTHTHTHAYTHTYLHTHTVNIKCVFKYKIYALKYVALMKYMSHRRSKNL